MSHFSRKVSVILWLLACSTSVATGMWYAAGLGTAAIAYKLHHMIRTPETFKPNVTNINLLLMAPQNTTPVEGVPVSQIIVDLEKGIAPLQRLIRINKAASPESWSISTNIEVASNENNLFVYSRGNSDRTHPTIDNLIGATGTPRVGGGILESYKYIKNNIINGPCISFDYFDSRRTLSFGQNSEKETFNVAYEEIVRKNPHAQIIFIGLCRGAKLALDFATENPKNLAAMILESPLISFQDATCYLGTHYLLGIPKNEAIMYNFFRYWFPSYNPSEDGIIQKLKKILSHIPILIGHLTTDNVISNRILYQTLQELEERNNVYLVVIEDKTKQLFHGKLSETKAFQHVCNAFLAKHEKTHNPELAQNGSQLLKDAHHNAHHAPEEWIRAIHTE